MRPEGVGQRRANRLAMPDLTANRTLVKSPPELWTELSEAESLARHLGEFGEIEIRRIEPEHTVAWEGEHARGMVEIEASGWGTKVTLTAEVTETKEQGGEDPAACEDDSSAPVLARPEGPPSDPPPAEPEEMPTPASDRRMEISAETSVAAESGIRERRRGRLGRWFRRRTASPRPVAETAALIHATAEPARLDAQQAPAAEEVPARQPDPATEAPQPEHGADSAPALDADRALQVLESTLDNLGQAHHRPFSRD